MANTYNLLRLVFSYSLVLLLSKGLTLSLNYIVAFSVDDAEFGYFSLAQVFFTTALVLLGFNSSAAYIRYYYSVGVAAVFAALRRIYLLLMALSIFLSLYLFSVFSHDRHFFWFSLLPLCGFLAAHVSSFNAVYRCGNNLVGYAFAELGRPVFVFVSLGVLLWRGGDFSVVSVYLISLCISLFLVVFISSFNFSREIFKKNNLVLSEKRVVLYLFPLFVVQIMALLNNVSDRYILTAFVTVEELGRYSKAYLVGSAAGMLVDSFSLLWAPYVVKRKDSFKSDLHIKVLCVFWGSIFLSISLLFFAAFVFAYKITVLHLDYIFLTMSVIILSAFTARVGYQIFVPVLSAFDLTGLVARLSAIGAVSGVVVNFILIPFWGGIGAALATFVSFMVFSILSFVLTHKKIINA